MVDAVAGYGEVVDREVDEVVLRVEAVLDTPGVNRYYFLPSLSSFEPSDANPVLPAII